MKNLTVERFFKAAGLDPSQGKAKRLIESIEGDNDALIANDWMKYNPDKLAKIEQFVKLGNYEDAYATAHAFLQRECDDATANSVASYILRMLAKKNKVSGFSGE